MYLSLLFLLLLALPGYVLVRHFFSEDLESGLLGTIGLSYVAIFGLLSPISICCYLFQAPVWVFSAACILAILAAPIELSRRKWWGGLFKLLIAGACVELLLVVIEMFLSARVGAGLVGDARVHLGRIRFILDHGFSNFDPYCAVPYFYPIYHTNIFHALYAAATQISGAHLLPVWFASLPWGQLLAVTGSYYLVWSIFNRRWPAWVAAIYVLALTGTVTFNIYPNKLSPYWAAPYVIGFVIQACRAQPPRRVWIKLAAGALILGQIHPLYAAYTAAVTLPVLAAVLLYRQIRHGPNRRTLAACLFAVCLALPFPAISKLKARRADQNAQQAQPPAQDDSGRYLRFDNGWLMLNPKLGIGPAGLWTAPIFLLGVALAMAGRRRHEAGLMLAIGSVALVVFYIPPLCALAMRTVQSEWILGRFGFVRNLLFVAFAPGALAFAIESRTRRWWIRSLLSLLVFAAICPFQRKPYDWRNYLKTAASPPRTRQARLLSYQFIRQFLEQTIPAGQTVLCHGLHGIDLVMLRDAYVVASASSSLGVLDLPQRRRDLDEMLSPATPWTRRSELLDRYGIKYLFFFERNPPPPWASAHAEQVSRKLRAFGGAFMVMRLKKT